MLQNKCSNIGAISGASAGAVNAVTPAHGWAQARTADPVDACESARKALRQLWRNIAALNPSDILSEGLTQWFSGAWFTGQTGTQPPNPMTPLMRPILLDINPVRRLLARDIDFKAVAESKQPPIFISATQALTGQSHVFSGNGLDLAAVSASVCVSTLFRTVKQFVVQPYWNGGFSSNPPLYPLIKRNAPESQDINLVQILPLHRPKIPQQPHEIFERMTELAFNASVLSKMRGIDFVNRQIAAGRLTEGEPYKTVRLHRIDATPFFAQLPPSWKLSTYPLLIDQLYEQGEQAGTAWLETHLRDFGQRSTAEIPEKYEKSL